MIQRIGKFGKWIRPGWRIAVVLAIALVLSVKFGPYYLCGAESTEILYVVQLLNVLDEVLRRTVLMFLVIGLMSLLLAYLPVGGGIRRQKATVRAVIIGVILLLLVAGSGIDPVMSSCP